MGDRKVVVRTLDAGADKPLAFASTREEENPALGQRGLRLSMVREDLIDTQLQALAAADSQTDADLWVMAPMVSTIEEARWFADHARAAGLKRVGIMIEVPAAALRAKKLAKVVDFFSIGSQRFGAVHDGRPHRCCACPVAEPWRQPFWIVFTLLAE